MAVGAMLGAAITAACCFGVLATPSGDAAHADEPTPQAMRGASAAATQLSAPRRLPGVAAAAEVPTTTTTTTPPLPPATTTTPRPTTTTPPPTTTTHPTVPKPTFPTTFPTFPTSPRHHCHHRVCSFPG
ncbi:MAG TPA: hypothetical protein VHV74_07190 [Pseudonocardiaceae bacterium]|nr:hypothetical protein [Pseudonocardiaceae bacterium]